MANANNLKSIGNLTTKEQREITSKGGKASAKARRKRKMLKEELLILLANEDTKKKMSVALVNQALKGNIKAFEVIRDTIGEKPNGKVELEANKSFDVNIRVIH